MSTSGAAHDRRKAVEEAAAGWYARIQLGAPSARDRRAFEDWLSSDAAHARAYDGYQKLWSTLGPAGTDPRVGAARRELLATVSAHRLRSAHWRGAAIAASVLLAFVAAGALGLAARGPPRPGDKPASQKPPQRGPRGPAARADAESSC